MDIITDHARTFAPDRSAPRDAMRLQATALTPAARREAAAQVRWSRLAERAAEPNPFFEWWYLLPSLDALDPAGDVTLLVIERDGEWLGLLPVIRERRYYGYPVPQWRSWLHANAFLGAPLVAQGHEAVVWEALLAWMDRMAGKGLFLHLPGLPLEGPLHAALAAVCTAQRRTIAVVHREERALLQSDLGADAYLEAALSGKKRKELRRQFARLSDEGAVSVERRRDQVDLAAWTNDFLKLEQAGWKGTAGSALACSPHTAQLFSSALASAGALGRLERLTLTLAGRPIAMLATFLAGNGAFSYKTAFDESYARFSPGVLLQRENLALLEDPHIAWCDSCAAADHPMIDHLWRERRAVGHVSLAVGGPLRRAAFRLFVAAELARSHQRTAPSSEPAGDPE